MALAVPTHLKNEVGTASRRMNTFWQRTIGRFPGCLCGNGPLSGSPPDPHMPFLQAKFAYVILNTPTPCPPRGAVPVNHGEPCDAVAAPGKNSVRNASRSRRCELMKISFPVSCQRERNDSSNPAVGRACPAEVPARARRANPDVRTSAKVAAGCIWTHLQGYSVTRMAAISALGRLADPDDRVLLQSLDREDLRIAGAVDHALRNFPEL